MRAFEASATPTSISDLTPTHSSTSSDDSSRHALFVSGPHDRAAGAALSGDGRLGYGVVLTVNYSRRVCARPPVQRLAFARRHELRSRPTGRPRQSRELRCLSCPASVPGCAGRSRGGQWRHQLLRHSSSALHLHRSRLFPPLERYDSITSSSIWTVQLIWSPLWLRYFRFGPVEWLWRYLTYLKRPPLRRTAVPVTAYPAPAM